MTPAELEDDRLACEQGWRDAEHDLAHGIDLSISDGAFARVFWLDAHPGYRRGYVAARIVHGTRLEERDDG